MLRSRHIGNCWEVSPFSQFVRCGGFEVIWDLHTKLLTSRHKTAGKEFFVNQVFFQNKKRGNYYETLIYRKSLELVRKRGTCEEAFLAASEHEIRIPAIYMETKVPISDWQSHGIWIFPAKFACTGFISDLCYLPE